MANRFSNVDEKHACGMFDSYHWTVDSRLNNQIDEIQVRVLVV